MRGDREEENGDSWGEMLVAVVKISWLEILQAPV